MCKEYRNLKETESDVEKAKERQDWNMSILEKELRENSYPGRGIVIGRSADGSKAITAYFIMGRSSNSRNRVFVTEGEGIRTEAFDPSKMEDPSEPDGPNYTPRISGIMHIENGRYSYAMSILKSDQGDPSACLRYTFAFENPLAGKGRFIHTYDGDGNPLPSFTGEPTVVDFDQEFTADIDTFTDRVWDALNEDNKVSLFVRFINIADGTYETRIVNKNQ